MGAEQRTWGRAAGSAVSDWCRQRGSPVSLPPAQEQAGNLGRCLQCVEKGDVPVRDVSQQS